MPTNFYLHSSVGRAHFEVAGSNPVGDAKSFIEISYGEYNSMVRVAGCEPVYLGSIPSIHTIPKVAF